MMISGVNTFKEGHPCLFWSSIGAITAVALFAVGFGAARLLNSHHLPAGFNRTWAIASVTGGSLITAACLIFIAILRTKREDKLPEEQQTAAQPEEPPRYLPLVRPSHFLREAQRAEPRDGQPYHKIDLFGQIFRPIYCCAPVGNRGLVATGSDQGLFTIRELGGEVITEVQHEHAIHQLAVSSVGHRAAILDSQNRVHIWRGVHFDSIGEGIEDVHSIALSGDGSLLVLGQNRRNALIQNLNTGLAVTLQHAGANEHDVNKTLVACSADGSTILTVPGNMDRCTFWGSFGEPLQEDWTGGFAETSAIALSADGQKALFINGGGDDDANVTLFDRNLGCTIIATGNNWHGVAFAPDQSKIAIIGSGRGFSERVVTIYTYDGARTLQSFCFETEQKCSKLFFSGNSLITLEDHNGAIRSFYLTV